MNKSEKIEKLRQILALDPSIFEILKEDTTLEEKRRKLRGHLSDLLLTVFDESQQIPPLEWIVCRDATWVMRNFLAPRSEKLAGFSFLEFIHTFLLHPERANARLLTPDFLAELKHLIKAVGGISGIYTEKPPAFLKHSGRKAAKMRSADLSKMARNASKFLQRYPSGIDPERVATQSRNRQAIQNHFDITDVEWNDWGWHTRNIIRDADALSGLVKLSEDEYRAISGAKKNRIPFGITPYYVSLMDADNSGTWDRAIRAQVIPPVEYVTKMTEHKRTSECSMDFMIEHDTSPIEGITRRYPNIVILKPVLTCPQICVYCQRNWQIEDVYSAHAALGEKNSTEPSGG